jgi:hypothetical protein
MSFMKKNAKICCVIPSLQPGGMERVMSVLINGFIQQYDADVHVQVDVNPMYNGVDYSDYIQIGADRAPTDTLSIPANSSVTNTIYVALIKPVEEDVQLSFSFTFTATAVEREEVAEP